MAIARMSQALHMYIILGIKTNISFLKRIMDTSTFARGDYDTHFIDEHEVSLLPKHEALHDALIGAVLYMSESLGRRRESSTQAAPAQRTPWQELGLWELCRRRS
jgi:acetyl-CoA carboxylase biotin carboxylase subunit